MDHICQYLAALAKSPLSDLQSTKWWFYLLRVPILCHCARIGGPKMTSSILSLMFVDISPHMEESFT